MTDVIVAQATPQGSGALAIVRLSGRHVREIVSDLVILKSKKNITEVLTHTVHYGEFFSPDRTLIDQVVIMVMDAPRSFTGENTIEITCHNNQYIIKKIIQSCTQKGCRLAFRGEFTERAVLHKKIDIFQAEAINDLIHAQSEIATDISLKQVIGSLSSEIEKIDYALIEIAAWCQASFEFLEEERDFREQILEKVFSVKKTVTELLSSHSFYRIFKEGIRISIVGSVNVGKSSLFNALLGYKRAIVNHVPGTTRDTIEAHITFGEFNATLIDTAGIRLTNDEIEKEGIEKSYYELKVADVILLVYSEETIKNNLLSQWYYDIYDQYKNKIICVMNKADNHILNEFFSEELLTSAHTGLGICQLKETIGKYIEKKYATGSLSYVVNSRQAASLTLIYEKLEMIVNQLSLPNIFYEIILHYLNDLQEIISNLSLKSIEERSFDKVFREFCIGK